MNYVNILDNSPKVICPYFLITGFLIIMSFLYMWYECYRVVEGSYQKSSWRAFCVTAYGFIVGLGFSNLGVFIAKQVFAKEMLAKGMIVDFIHPGFFFASASLFIGIFIQVLWEEKTIAEPL